MGCATWCFWVCSKRKMTSQTTVSIACLNGGRFWTHTCFKSMHVQLLAVPTVPTVPPGPPARSAWSWRRPSGRHSSALTALGPSLGIPMCPRYPTLWGWWMWMKRTSTPTTLCQVPAVLHEKSVCFACLLAAKNTVCFWFGSLATASLRGSSYVLCFFFSFDLPYSTWYDMYI